MFVCSWMNTHSYTPLKFNNCTKLSDQFTISFSYDLFHHIECLHKDTNTRIIQYQIFLFIMSMNMNVLCKIFYCWVLLSSSLFCMYGWIYSYQIKSNQITFIVTSSQHMCLDEWNSWERAPDSAETINI